MAGADFQVFVYSHTHKAETAFSPFATVDPADASSTSSWLPLVVNSGAWQRVMTEVQLKAMKDRNLNAAAVLKLRPEDLPACYSAIVIDEREQTLEPVLRWWHRVSADRWELSAPSLAPECPETLVSQDRR